MHNNHQEPEFMNTNEQEVMCAMDVEANFGPVAG